MENTKWKIKEYDQWIRNKCPLNEHVLELDISHSNLTSLVNLQNLVNLKKLYCRSNSKSLHIISYILLNSFFVFALYL